MMIQARRDLLLALGCLSTAGAAVRAQPRRIEDDFSGSRLSDLAPQEVGSWRQAVTSGDIVPESVDASKLYEQTLTRTYIAPGLPSIMMVLAYRAPESRELKIHRPETCYAVAGFQVETPALTVVPFGEESAELRAVTFRAQRGARTEDVLYWSRVVNEFPQTLAEQRITMLRLALSGVLSDGLLARFSTLSPSASPAKAQAMLQGFASTLIQAAPSRGRALLVGRSPPARA